MPDSITLTGLVATTPRSLMTNEGLAITSFRLASSQRRYDRSQNKWLDGDTNWYTVTSFRQLASNAATSVKKGDRVVVSGRLRIRDWASGDRAGTTIEVEADAVGHDLAWGGSVFTRTISSGGATSAAAAEFPEAVAATGSTDVESTSAADTDADHMREPAESRVDALALPF